METSLRECDPSTTASEVAPAGSKCLAQQTKKLCHLPPYSACALVDSAGSSVGLTLYNLADSTHFDIGDIVTLPDPHFKRVHLDDENVCKELKKSLMVI